MAHGTLGDAWGDAYDRAFERCYERTGGEGGDRPAGMCDAEASAAADKAAGRPTAAAGPPAWVLWTAGGLYTTWVVTRVMGIRWW